jgi:hypothetical protein
MPEELPIACSLDGAGLEERLAEIAAAGRVGLLKVERQAGAAVLSFRSGEGMRDRLNRIVAAESECCAFLEMKIQERDDSLELTIRGPEGARPIVEELVEAFSSSSGAGAC